MLNGRCLQPFSAAYHQQRSNTSINNNKQSATQLLGDMANEGGHNFSGDIQRRDAFKTQVIKDASYIHRIWYTQAINQSLLCRVGCKRTYDSSEYC